MSTKYLIYLTIFCAPLYLIKLPVFGLTISILDVLMLLTVFSFLTKTPHRLIDKYHHLKKIFPLLIAMIIGLILSTIFNGNSIHSWGIVISWFILPIFFGTITHLEIKENSDKLFLLKTIFYSSLLVVFLSLILFIVYNNGLTYDNRLKGFYSSPNYLAMYLSLGLIIAFFQINISGINFFSRKKPKNIFYFLSTIIIFFVLCLTKSQGALTAVTLSLFLIFAIQKYFLKNYFFIKISKKIGVVLFVLFALFIFTANLFFRLPPNIYKNHSSFNSRLIIWQSAGEILKNNWIWGIGPGNFQKKYLQYQVYFLPYQEWAVPQPHNLYLAFWLQSGLVGFCSFIILIYLVLKKLISKLMNHSNVLQKKLTLTLLTLIFAILIHGLVDTPIWKNDLSLIFWIIVFLTF